MAMETIITESTSNEDAPKRSRSPSSFMKSKRPSLELDDIFAPQLNIHNSKMTQRKQPQAQGINNDTMADDRFQFSYGNFTMNLSKHEIIEDPTIFEAINRTPELKYDQRILQLKIKRANLRLKAAMKFGNVAQLLKEEEQPEEKEGVSHDKTFGLDESTEDKRRGIEFEEDGLLEVHIRTQRSTVTKVVRRANNREGGKVGLVSSLPRTAFTSREFNSFSDELKDVELWTKRDDWFKSFCNLDPRVQILKFFNDLSLEGVENFEAQMCESSLAQSAATKGLLRGFIKSGIFSVWRPTSNDAIRKMITGEGTGKGLDIKGKSAKCGAFSGYVPFLQIHQNEHKKKVAPMRLHERVRVFYPNKASRDIAAKVLTMLSRTMSEMATSARGVINKGRGNSKIKSQADLRNQLQFAKEKSAALVTSNQCLMHDPKVYPIDDYVSTQGVYGLDIPEKLFWEGYVAPNDITRPKGSKYETGRASYPEFQQMNIETLRNWKESDSVGPEASPRPVLWHGDCGRVGEVQPEKFNPMCPRGLLMAYEENQKVIPVVSDFDCFLLGTRGVKYSESLGSQEVSMLSQCVDDIEGILATPKEGSNWTQRWLEVKKQHALDELEANDDEEDEHESKEMPKYGYADPRSYKMMTGAVNRLKSNGAVRHGPECFNYGFPQDLDDQYLVISDGFIGVPWRYLNAEQLLGALSAKVDQGFTFPLNPKWILCDQGWKAVYDQLLASNMPNVQDSMSIWYPDSVRRRIEDVSTSYPSGFSDSCDPDQSSGVQTDLAMLEFKNYMLRARSKKKFERTLMRQKRSGSLKWGRDSGINNNLLKISPPVLESPKNNLLKSCPPLAMGREDDGLAPINEGAASDAHSMSGTSDEDDMMSVGFLSLSRETVDRCENNAKKSKDRERSKPKKTKSNKSKRLFKSFSGSKTERSSGSNAVDTEDVVSEAMPAPTKSKSKSKLRFGKSRRTSSDV